SLRPGGRLVGRGDRFAAKAAPLKGAPHALSPAKNDNGGAEAPPPTLRAWGYLLGGLEIHGRRTATLCGDLVVDLLAFVQPVKARTLDSADVHEHVLAAVGRLDEPETLGGIEPLHGTCRHYSVSLV